jgi:hypothetical protein
VLGSSFSSVSSIVNLAFDFFGAGGVGASVRFRGDLSIIVDDLKTSRASRASSSACIWSFQSSLPSFEVDGIILCRPQYCSLRPCGRNVGSIAANSPYHKHKAKFIMSKVEM